MFNIKVVSAQVFSLVNMGALGPYLSQNNDKHRGSTVRVIRANNGNVFDPFFQHI
jgi:hypothetical protein